MKHKVLIIDLMHESILQQLAELGIEADYQPQIQRASILEMIENYIGMIVRSKTQIDAELLAKGKQLKFIGRAGSGTDLIDMEAVNQKNIAVLNAPEGNRDAVAEHTVGMLLMLMRNLHLADQQVRKEIWDREGNRGFEIKGKTVGIIGYGNVGQQTAKRLNAFECKILAYDIRKTDFGKENIFESSMEQIFEEADILTLHIPLTKQSFQMVDWIYLQKFKKDIILINTARGEIIQTEDLKKALQEGKVRGACLDVLENEKLNTLNSSQKETFEFFKKSPNVILTPHIAGWTYESYQRINKVLTEKIKNFLGL